MPINNFLKSQTLTGSGINFNGSVSATSYKYVKEGFVKILPNEIITIVPEALGTINREIKISLYSGNAVNLYFVDKNNHPKPLNNGEVFVDIGNGGIAIIGEAESEIILEVTVRQDKEIIYNIGNWEPPPPVTPPPPSWAIIAPDGLSALIDSSKFPNTTSVDASVIVPDYQSITNYQFFSSLQWRDQNGNSINSYSGYPTNSGEFITTINSSYSSINFQLTSEYSWTYLKISNFNLTTNTFTLINPTPQEWLFISPDNLNATLDGSQLTEINSWNLQPRQVKSPWLVTTPPEWDGDLDRELMAERKIRGTTDFDLAGWDVDPESVMQFDLNFNFHESVKFYVNRRRIINSTLVTIKSDYLKIIDFNFLTNTFTLEA